MKKTRMKAKAKNRWSRENIHYVLITISPKKERTHTNRLRREIYYIIL